MRAFVVTVIAAGAIVATGTAAGPFMPVQTVAVSVSSVQPGVRPLTLTFTLRYEMQCGDPGAGPVTLHLPQAMVVPKTIANRSVMLDGGAPSSVTVKGSKITIGIPPRSDRMICDVIRPGTLTVVLEPSADIGNPKTAGTYVFVVGAKPGTGLSMRLKIA